MVVASKILRYTRSFLSHLLMMATVKTTSEIIKPRVDVVFPLIFAYHFCRNLHLVGSEDSIADAGASPEK